MYTAGAMSIRLHDVPSETVDADGHDPQPDHTEPAEHTWQMEATRLANKTQTDPAEQDDRPNLMQADQAEQFVAQPPEADTHEPEHPMAQSETDAYGMEQPVTPQPEADVDGGDQVYSEQSEAEANHQDAEHASADQRPLTRTSDSYASAFDALPQGHGEQDVPGKLDAPPPSDDRPDVVDLDESQINEVQPEPPKHPYTEHAAAKHTKQAKLPSTVSASKAPTTSRIPPKRAVPHDSDFDLDLTPPPPPSKRSLKRARASISIQPRSASRSKSKS